MKRIFKNLTAMTAALALCLSLAACGGITAFDATTYIKGMLDETYLGVYDKAYLEITESTETESAETYETNINAEYEGRFIQYFEIDDEYISDETRDAIKQFLRDTYSHAKYEVAAATALEKDEYSVSVTFHPITLFSEFYEDEFDAYAEAFNATYDETTQEQIDAMSDEEYEAFWTEYEEQWATGLLETLQAKLANLGYADPVTKLIRVYLDTKENLYTISDEDFYGMDDMILEY